MALLPNVMPCLILLMELLLLEWILVMLLHTPVMMDMNWMAVVLEFASITENGLGHHPPVKVQINCAI